MEKKVFDELVAWIKDSYDQNDFCERCILVDAIKLLDKDEPEIDRAISRLFELTPLGGSKLVSPPDFAIDIENGKLWLSTEKYYELLNWVESKHDGETRHETALRYIKEREYSSDSCDKKEEAMK